MISDRLDLRSVKVDTLVPQVRIGLGERNPTSKEQRALKRVSMLMWSSNINVICGSFLPRSSAAQFGKPADIVDLLRTAGYGNAVVFKKVGYRRVPYRRVIRWGPHLL
jgi:hypothetical protein